MSRISSTQMHNAAVNSMIEHHSTLSKTQQQVASGKKIFKPSDDPVAASRMLTLKDTLSSVLQNQANVNSARARITLSEGVLSNFVEGLHRVRELSIQANNDSQDGRTRSFIASEVIQIQDELLNLANTTDSNNEYLYAGAMGRFKPFVQNDDGSFEYKGDDSSRQIQISRSRRIAVDDPGSEVFVEIKNGNGIFVALDHPENKGTGVIDPGQASNNYGDKTYAIIFDQSFSEYEGAIKPGEIPITYSVVASNGDVLSAGVPYVAGKEIDLDGAHTFIKGDPEDGDVFTIRPSQNQSVFTTLHNLIRALQSKSPEANTNIGFHNAMNRSISDITQSLDKILVVRGHIGARLNALDSQENINSTYHVQIKGILSNIEDLDFGEAVSKLNLELAGLEASQKAFTRVQGISLFDYI